MAQLITAAQCITYAFVDANTDASMIGDTFIEIAQEAHIRPALAWKETDDAESLYEQIVSQNNSSSLTTANQTLLDSYIIPALAFYVKYEMINDISIEVSSHGAQVQTPEFANAASDAQRREIKNQAYEHANVLRDKMIRYIEDPDNIASYPLYNSGNNVGNSVSRRGGIIMSGKTGQDIG